MAALKWIIIGICGLGAAGSFGLGFMEGGASEKSQPPALLPLAVRPLPVLLASATPAVEAPKTPEAKPPEGEAKQPEPVAKQPEPTQPEPKQPEPKQPEPKQPEPKQPEPKQPPPAKPPEAAARPPVPRPAAQPGGEGLLNLRASDTADVYVDGKKVGGSPVMGFKAKVGTRRVRFDCYDAAGNAIAGPVKTVTVKVDEEQDVEFTCPEPE
ncbi:MAG: hypothetical protein IT380_00255 [Myxococcales bacterium]|nr:hypothetical protein [Myxococcales bacterium]